MFESVSAIATTIFVLMSTLILGRVAFGLQAQTEGYSLSDQTLNQDNSAVTLRWAGMMVALVIAILGVYSPVGGSAATSLVSGVMAFVMAIVALGISRYVNDRVILHVVDNHEAVVDKKNVAVAIVEFSTYLATALIFAGGISAPGQSLGQSVLWFVVGQAILVGIAHAYRRLFPSVFAEIKNGNAACAISLAGLLLSVGIAIAMLVHGPSNGLVSDLIGISVSLAVWLVLMAATRGTLYLCLGISPARLTSELVTDRNWSLAFIDATLFVVITIAFIKIH